MTSNVTIVPHVEEGPGVTQFQSVTEYVSTTAGATQGDLVLISGGVVLLMTGGSLLLV